MREDAAASPERNAPAVRGRHFLPRRRRVRAVLLAAVALLVAAAAVGARLATMPIPAATTQVLVPATTVLPGRLTLAWPAGGEAAIASGDGTLLGTSGPAGAVAIASVAKVMTAYVVVTDHPLAPGQPGPPLTISAAEAATLPARIAAGQSVVPVQAGLVLDEYQALQALLLASADNIADVLARDDAGSTAAFVARMNAAAARLGMTHTHYADPSGLDPATVSTPADQLRLARVVLRDPVLAAIADQPSAVIPGAGTISNYNTLAGQDGFTGIKTGSTTPAGGCLLFSVTRTVAAEPYTFIGIVLGQRHGPYIAAGLAAARALADSLFTQIQARPVLPAGRPVLAVGRAGRQGLAVTDAPLQVTGLPGQTVTVTVASAPGPDLRAGRGGPAGSVAASTSTAFARVSLRSPTLPPPTLGWRIGHLIP